MTRLFLDTNIVVDVLERREPFCHDAVRKDFTASKLPVMTASEYLATIESQR